MGTFFSEERDGWVRDEVARVTVGWEGVRQKPMMGCACFWARGTMFAIVANGCVVLTRLTPDERAGLGGEPFWTGPGKPPIRKWVQVRVAEPADVQELEPALRRSHERALRLAAEAGGQADATSARAAEPAGGTRKGGAAGGAEEGAALSAGARRGPRRRA